MDDLFQSDKSLSETDILFRPQIPVQRCPRDVESLADIRYGVGFIRLSPDSVGCEARVTPLGVLGNDKSRTASTTGGPKRAVNRAEALKPAVLP